MIKELMLNKMFKHGPELVKKCEYSTKDVETLWKCYSDEDIWGPKGTGYRRYLNSQFIVEVAQPFLLTKDKEGFIEMCKKLQNDKNANSLIWKKVNEKLELAFQKKFDEMLEKDECSAN